MNEWVMNATGMIRWNNSFYINELKVNNTGWVMKLRWREGVEWSASPSIWENAEPSLIYIFLHQMREQCLEFALPNPGEICKHLAGAYNLHRHALRLLLSYFVCKNKQGNHSNGANFLWRFVSEKLSIINPLWRRRNTCSVMIPLTLLRKRGEKGKSVTTSS